MEQPTGLQELTKFKKKSLSELIAESKTDKQADQLTSPVPEEAANTQEGTDENVTIQKQESNPIQGMEMNDSVPKEEDYNPGDLVIGVGEVGAEALDTQEPMQDTDAEATQAAIADIVEQKEQAATETLEELSPEEPADSTDTPEEKTVEDGTLQASDSTQTVQEQGAEESTQNETQDQTAIDAELQMQAETLSKAAVQDESTDSSFSESTSTESEQTQKTEQQHETIKSAQESSETGQEDIASNDVREADEVPDSDSTQTNVQSNEEQKPETQPGAQDEQMASNPANQEGDTLIADSIKTEEAGEGELGGGSTDEKNTQQVQSSQQQVTTSGSTTGISLHSALQSSEPVNTLATGVITQNGSVRSQASPGKQQKNAKLTDPIIVQPEEVKLAGTQKASLDTKDTEIGKHISTIPVPEVVPFDPQAIPIASPQDDFSSSTASAALMPARTMPAATALSAEEVKSNKTILNSSGTSAFEPLQPVDLKPVSAAKNEGAQDIRVKAAQDFIIQEESQPDARSKPNDETSKKKNIKSESKDAVENSTREQNVQVSQENTVNSRITNTSTNDNALLINKAATQHDKEKNGSDESKNSSSSTFGSLFALISLLFFVLGIIFLFLQFQDEIVKVLEDLVGEDLVDQIMFWK